MLRIQHKLYKNSYVLSNSIGSLTTRYGNTWYDVDSIYVNFVERWEDKPDEAIVADAYSDMIDVLSKSGESLLSFTWVDKKGSVKAICMVSNFLGKINLSEILWFNDYERLNDNEFAHDLHTTLNGAGT